MNKSALIALATAGTMALAGAPGLLWGGYRGARSVKARTNAVASNVAKTLGASPDEVMGYIQEGKIPEPKEASPQAKRLTDCRLTT